MPTYAPQSVASFGVSTPTFLSPLLADGHGVTSRKGTVASGIGVLKRGTICKIVAATGVITVGATAAEANCVLVDDIDATTATVQADVYLTGRMKADAVTWPGALSHADVTDALRDVGIYLESVMITDGSLAKSLPTGEEQKEAIANLEKARAAAKEAKAEAEAQEKQKPSDAPFQYLTPDEREQSADLAPSALAIAAEEFAEEQGEKEEKPKKQEPPKRPEPPPPPRK